jgi:hypothetical protein
MCERFPGLEKKLQASFRFTGISILLSNTCNFMGLHVAFPGERDVPAEACDILNLCPFFNDLVYRMGEILYSRWWSGAPFCKYLRCGLRLLLITAFTMYNPLSL